MLFQLCAALLDHGNQFGPVFEVWVHLLKQRQVVGSEPVDGRLHLLVRVSQRLERTGATVQAGLKQFPLHVHHTPFAQFMPMRHVTCPRNQLQVGEVFAGQVNNFEALLFVVNGDHQHACHTGAGRAQQIQARRIAIKDAITKTARGFNHFGVVVKHGAGVALGNQQAANDLPKAAKTGDDDGG